MRTWSRDALFFSNNSESSRNQETVQSLSAVRQVPLLSLELSGYRRVSDRFIEVEHNEISKLGNLNGDRVRLIEVTVK